MKGHMEACEEHSGISSGFSRFFQEEMRLLLIFEVFFLFRYDEESNLHLSNWCSSSKLAFCP
ncbi:hypothetical protein J437_LFUL016976 [Ladona fulva]|uniref:Uncharacterized protein n=1 Tax=Ladona fulva TaxID=123851 RepID=A0A8K0KJM1_LADFU|nr:hypothetical protein J437_LFUL016976 [Ladona fulva]